MGGIRDQHTDEHISHGGASNLRGIGNDLGREQSKISTGLRVASASDNAAYWSISTTMRSETMAMSAVTDAIGFASGIVDTAYAAMETVHKNFVEIRNRAIVASDMPQPVATCVLAPDGRLFCEIDLQAFDCQRRQLGCLFGQLEKKGQVFPFWIGVRFLREQQVGEPAVPERFDMGCDCEHTIALVCVGHHARVHGPPFIAHPPKVSQANIGSSLRENQLSTGTKLIGHGFPDHKREDRRWKR
ncbi:MAG TPA: hypothetical protein VGN93_04370 [Shinella sp.]|uniref:flagellin N-terminal helical domain-containing protein n=1 Tax=Shinella sp. TaxID=1870904 RepID=UPI002E0EAF2B|nr:hypothetical protein [Shinella sp.]